jgi:hypothetical protein
MMFLTRGHGLALAKGREGNVGNELTTLADDNAIRQPVAGAPLLQVVINGGILLGLSHLILLMS